MRYGIAWDVVAGIPLILGLLLADHLGNVRKARKAEKKTMNKAAEETETAPPTRTLLRRRKSGFRNMKSNAQRIRERARRREEASSILTD